MKVLYTVLILSMAFRPTLSGGHYKPPDEINIVVDPRIELLSTVCRLAGYEEYMMGSYPSYFKAAGDYFNPYKEHKAVLIARKIRESNGIAYNAPMGLAVFLNGVENITSMVPYEKMVPDIDARWTPEIMEEFIIALDDFVRVSGFISFFMSNKGLYETAVSRFRDRIDDNGLKEWSDLYFGGNRSGSFTIILGLQNGGSNYAARTTDARGQRNIFSIIGCWSQDSLGMPLFDPDIVSYVAHEFFHSFINPLVEKYKPDLEENGRRIFQKVEREMTGMAYSDWKLVMNETLVRACVIRYLYYSKGAESSQIQARREFGNGFVWIDYFTGYLEDFENMRNVYTNLSSYMEQLGKRFNEQSDDIIKKIEETRGDNLYDWEMLKLEGPRVIYTYPENGSKAVDPSISEIRVKFDRKMKPGFAVMKTIFENFPETRGEMRWEEDGSLFIMPVKLKPDWVYVIGFNAFTKAFFSDEAGRPLYPCVLNFETSK